MNRREVLTAVSGGGFVALSGCSDVLGDVTGHNVEEVKENAESIGYDDLYRNVNEYKGDPVTYSEIRITDVVETDDDYQEFILRHPDNDWGESKYLYGLWEGTLFRQDDTVTIWGVVNGTHTYMSLMGEQTVPELDLVDIELIESG
ncbi:hypothetical protein [Halomontanus rarus]|uniref:hypothetical protein n=1 Tax=Halomontanus rarus TaxID=3034020 RepID=UPI0023E78156|nr:hypothetical protein [Halovivax sp. TS33]